LSCRSKHLSPREREGPDRGAVGRVRGYGAGEYAEILRIGRSDTGAYALVGDTILFELHLAAL